MTSYFAALKKEIRESNGVSLCIFLSLALIQGPLYDFCGVLLDS